MSAEPSSRVEVKGEVAPAPLPCPFCGYAEIEDYHEFDRMRGWIEWKACPRCKARGPSVECGNGPDTAIKAERETLRLWNTRHFQVTQGWTASEREHWIVP